MNDRSYPYHVDMRITLEDFQKNHRKRPGSFNEWFNDNAVDFYSLRSNKNPRCDENGKLMLRYRFKNEVDAVAFRLRFG